MVDMSSRAYLESLANTYNSFYHRPSVFNGLPSPGAIALGRLLAPGATVLDWGCGSGRNTLYLADMGCCITGLDLAPQALNLAEAAARTSGLADSVRLVRGGMSLSKLPGQFDAVLLSFLLNHFDPPESDHIIAAATARLGRGGRLLIEAYVRPRAKGQRGYFPRNQEEIEEAMIELGLLPESLLTYELYPYTDVAAVIARRIR
jgi:cyclopropane fatty-acyl-phospholipid synthase-like methyltransferase